MAQASLTQVAAAVADMAAAAAIRRSRSRFLVSAVLLLSVLNAHAEESHRKGRHLGLIPISNFSSDAGYTFGALAQYFDYGESLPLGIGVRPFQSLLTLQSTYATQGPKDALISYETYFDRAADHSIDPGALRGYVEFYGMETEYARYYGLGAFSQRDSTLDSQGFNFYDRRYFSIEGALRKRLYPLGGMDLQIGIRQTATVADPGPGAGGDSQYLRDFGAGRNSTSYSQLRISTIWERRDSEFIPSRGWYAHASLATAPLAGWSRVDLDYRRYFPLLEGRSLWLATQLRYTGTDSDAPLHEKARLGSLGTFRGVPINRYLSNHSASLRTELRSMWLSMKLLGMPLRLGSGLYTDLGRLSGRLPELSSSPTRAAWGVALFGSYFTDDFLGSADLGFSAGQTSLYLRLGHAF